MVLLHFPKLTSLHSTLQVAERLKRDLNAIFNNTASCLKSLRKVAPTTFNFCKSVLQRNTNSTAKAAKNHSTRH
jgi:hypothetical protein